MTLLIVLSKWTLQVLPASFLKTQSKQTFTVGEKTTLDPADLTNYRPVVNLNFLSKAQKVVTMQFLEETSVV